MRIAICDDDKCFLDEMERMLLEYSFVKQTERYSQISSFIADIKAHNSFDLVLMDIAWEEAETGIDYSEQLYKIAPHLPVIFVTGYNDRFSQYILLKQTNLVGYLTKPIQRELLEKYLNKVLKRQASEEGFSFQQQGRMMTIQARSIIYIESSNHVSLIHTENVTYRVYKKLRDLLPQLPAYFIQCHKSYLVNMYWIQRMEQGSILLQNGERILVSRSYSAGSRESVLRFMGLQI